MPRKIAYLIAALIVPGGFVALFGALAFHALQRTERGRKVLALARRNVPAWTRAGGDPAREAA